MANGPFGNPLSTGIALSFEVDMTPYREMHKRKLLAAKEKEEDKKKKQQQYADILKNITPPDASKIHKKYMPEVQNQYAELIDSAMGYINKNDVASLHKHMFEFDSNAKKAVQATENYKKYVNSDANKTFKNIEAIRAMEDDNTSIGDIFDKYQNDVEYGDGYLFWSTIERPDLLGETNKVLQGAEKTLVFDGGKPVVMGRMPETDEVIYKESVKDPDKVVDYLSGWLMSSPGGNRLLMEYGGINAGQLDERTPDGMQKRAALAREYVSKEIEPKLYGQKISKIPQEKESKGWTFGGGGAKSPNWEVNKVSNIPVSLTDEVGGSLSGWKVDYTKQTGQKELQRSVELGKGAYFAEGGRKIHKISDASTGMGMVIEATPAGVYVRDDKEGGQVWAAYETNYMPPKDDIMKGFKFDPNKPGTEEEQKQAWINISMDEEEDRISKTKRIVYVPLKSENEKIEFRTAMGMSADEFDKLLKEIGASPATGTQSSESTTSTGGGGMSNSDFTKLVGNHFTGGNDNIMGKLDGEDLPVHSGMVVKYPDGSIKDAYGAREGSWFQVIKDGKVLNTMINAPQITGDFYPKLDVPNAVSVVESNKANTPSFQ